MRLRFATTICLALCLGAESRAEQPPIEPWRIVSAADWHSAEGGVTSRNPAHFDANQAKERGLIRGTLFGRPEVVLIAGDVGSGHWTTGALKKAGALRDGETIEEAIHRLGAKTYRTMKENFAEAGVELHQLNAGILGVESSRADDDGAQAGIVLLTRQKLVNLIHQQVIGLLHCRVVQPVAPGAPSKKALAEGHLVVQLLSATGCPRLHGVGKLVQTSISCFR